METNTDLDITQPSISFAKSDKAFNFFMFIILIIVIFIIIIPWDKLGFHSKKEGMTGGTLTQLMAQDSQDVYLKSNVDKLATGNFDLFWNQPTRVANTFMNRGTPLPSIYLPDTSMNPTKDPVIVSNNYTDYILNKTKKTCKYDDSNGNFQKQVSSKSEKTFPNPLVTSGTKDYLQMNNSNIADNTSPEFILPNNQIDQTNQTNPGQTPTIPDNILPSSLSINVATNSNPYELSKVAKQIVTTQKTANNLPNLLEQTRPIDTLYQAYTNNLLYNKDCIGDPASCGGGPGGYRLGEDYVQSTRAKPVVNIDGNAFYPDSYVGSYFAEPDFNIMHPIPWMPKSNLPPNPVKMG